MPFAQRAVTPVRLSRQKVDEEHKFDFDVTSNNTLVGVLLQLSSLVHHADTIFEDLTQECHNVIYRTQRIKSRIGEVTTKVEKLNAKAVRVREYSLL